MERVKCSRFFFKERKGKEDKEGNGEAKEREGELRE